jgi:hypothetical protein
VDFASPWKTAVMITPPRAWKTMMKVTRAARSAAGDSSAAYVGPVGVSWSPLPTTQYT